MGLFVWLEECDLLTYHLLATHEHEQTTNEQWPLLFIKLDDTPRVAAET
jgi:hypothetical protein